MGKAEGMLMLIKTKQSVAAIYKKNSERNEEVNE